MLSFNQTIVGSVSILECTNLPTSEHGTPAAPRLLLVAAALLMGEERMCDGVDGAVRAYSIE
jgi:hypothetical protein